MFSGGDYDEVARWLRNFVSSHAKRENPRVEAVVEAGRGREGETMTERGRFYRLGGFAYRRRWAVLAVWLVRRMR